MAGLQNYEASDFPKPRPNSMNNYGIVLNDMGFEAMFDLLLEDYLKPLAGALFPDVSGGGNTHYVAARGSLTCCVCYTGGRQDSGPPS